MRNYTFQPIEPRIKARSRLSDTGCVEWIGSNCKGYAILNINGRRTLVHRYVYEQKHGAIPIGKEIDHLCRNKSCINVDHLEAVTHSVNMLRSNPAEYNAEAKKTHCPHGHPYSPENTIRVKRGRVCKTCNQLRNRIYKARTGYNRTYVHPSKRAARCEASNPSTVAATTAQH